MRQTNYVWQRIGRMAAPALLVLAVGLWGVTTEVSAQNQIQDWNDLDEIRNDLGDDYELVNNLDENTAGYDDVAGPDANEGAGFDPIGEEGDSFEGFFNGNGYTISGLTINRPEEDNVGLFGSVDGSDSFEQFGLIDADIMGGNSTGGVVGLLDGGGNDEINFDQIFVRGAIEGGDNVGGILGGMIDPRGNPDITISDSYVIADIHGFEDVGGFIGFFDIGGASNVTIESSYISGSITGDNDNTGVIIGNLETTGNPDVFYKNVYFDSDKIDDELTDIGSEGDVDGVHGLPTDEMQGDSAPGNMVGFDFDETWSTVPNYYPRLSWEPAFIQISGVPGWRMLSLPQENATIEDLMEQNQLAFPGADAHEDYEDVEGYDYTDPSAWNFYFFNTEKFSDFDDNDPEGTTSDGTDQPGWTAPEDTSDAIGPGEGFIWFFFDEEDESPLSKGPEFRIEIDPDDVPEGDQEIDLITTSDIDDNNIEDAWNLVGNPFYSNLDPEALYEDDNGDGINEGLESAVIQVWDHGEADDAGVIGGDQHFVTINLGDSDEDANISVGQSFFVHNDSLGEFTIPEDDAKTDDSAEFLRETGALERHQIAFTLEGENSEYGYSTLDRAISLYFSEGSTAGWDVRDALKLTPYTAPYATLSFVGERNGNSVYKAQESRPIELDGETIEIPMHLEKYYMSGNFDLSWEGMEDIPSDWSITLTDNETGETADLRTQSEFRFDAEGDMQLERRGVLANTPQAQMPKAQMANAKTTDDEDYRFTLTISDEDPTSSPEDPDVPEEIALEQNYPNPFNPATTISYQIPEQTHVELTVYDTMGREVATLVDGNQQAGSHEVNWNAEDFASGTYIYRLRVDGQVQSQTMTLVK